jgi:hypothetical protein
MLAIYGFHSDFFFVKKLYVSKLQFQTTLLPYKSVLLRIKHM